MFSTTVLLGLAAPLFLLAPGDGPKPAPEIKTAQQLRQFALDNLGDSQGVLSANVSEMLKTDAGKWLAKALGKRMKATAELGFDPLESVEAVVAGGTDDVKETLFFVFGKFDVKKMLGKVLLSLKDLPGMVSLEKGRLILKIPEKIAGEELYVTQLGNSANALVVSPSKKRLLAVVSPGGMPTKGLKPLLARLDGKQEIQFAVHPFPEVAPFGLKPMDLGIASIVGHITVTGTLSGQIHAACKSKEKAEKLSGLLQFVSLLAQEYISKQGAEQPSMALLYDLVRNMRWSTKEDQLTLDWRFTEKVLQDYLKNLPPL